MRKLYMLDTDTASYVIRGTDAQILNRFTGHFGEICISSITAGELKFGAVKKQSPLLTQKVDAFCDLVPIKDFDFRAAEKYGSLRAELERVGTPLASMDLLIAASALAENAILVTNNTAHFSKVPGLNLENWTIYGNN